MTREIFGFTRELSRDEFVVGMEVVEIDYQYTGIVTKIEEDRVTVTIGGIDHIYSFEDLEDGAPTIAKLRGRYVAVPVALGDRRE